MALEIHWKAPIQAKGFLKLIEMFIALLAFALVAGFTVTDRFDCELVPNSTSEAEYIDLSAKFPYKRMIATRRIQNSSGKVDRPLEFGLPSQYKQAAEFFVVWGIFSIFYGIIAILVYMLTTANAQLESLVNYLVLSDLVCHIMWVLCWFIASVVWASAQVSMKKYISDTVIEKDIVKDFCAGGIKNTNPGSYVQAAIADVFGFTSFFLWGLNIYWVVLDTSFYLQWKGRGHRQLIED